MFGVDPQYSPPSSLQEKEEEQEVDQEQEEEQQEEQIESSNHRKLCRPGRSHQGAIWNVNFNHFLDLSICPG